MVKQGQYALVIGLGASGRAAAELLVALGMRVRGYDQRERLEAEPELVKIGVELHLGQSVLPEAAVHDVDLVVLSPGVPPEPVHETLARHAPRAQVTGELGLALELYGDLVGERPATVLITGTNGKSTVTALTGALLSAGGMTPFVGGNLGTPLCRHLLEVHLGQQPRPDALVLECSSFQLETLPSIERMGPTSVGMVLNVTPDHLDRYPDLATYARTKARVFSTLDARGLALLDAHDLWTPTLRSAVGSATLLLARQELRLEEEREPAMLVVGAESWPRSALRLPGRHNALNALFALAAARHLGVEHLACLEGLSAFEGLPHRMHLVGERDGIVFYNDSKATNVASALASLGGLERPFVLIAGGKAKGDDFTPLIDLLRDKARALVTVGEAGPSLHALAEGVLPTCPAASIDASVEVALRYAVPGDAIVLAPACASYDQFRNYAERGDAFEAAAARWLSR